MSSTYGLSDRSDCVPSWRAAGLHFHTYRHFLQQRFGTRIYRVSLDGGFTCPNVDGHVARGGCVYCDNRSFSPSRRAGPAGIAAQLERGIARLRSRYQAARFLAYFQPATNTYAPVSRLRQLYFSVLEHPLIIGVVIGTRPDCVPPNVLDLIAELAQRTYVCVEYGMQTAHDRSLDWINRGHHHDAMLDAVARSRGRGFDIAAHLILGLPDESHADMMATVRELVRLDLDGVKFHNLHAVADTPLADMVLRGETRLMSRQQYITTLADALELLPASMVIQRICGDAPRQYLVAPSWCLDKAAVRRALDTEFAQRDSWQGKRRR